MTLPQITLSHVAAIWKTLQFWQKNKQIGVIYVCNAIVQWFNQDILMNAVIYINIIYLVLQYYNNQASFRSERNLIRP